MHLTVWAFGKGRLHSSPTALCRAMSLRCTSTCRCKTEQLTLVFFLRPSRPALQDRALGPDTPRASASSRRSGSRCRRPTVRWPAASSPGPPAHACKPNPRGRDLNMRTQQTAITSERFRLAARRRGFIPFLRMLCTSALVFAAHLAQIVQAQNRVAMTVRQEHGVDL